MKNLFDMRAPTFSFFMICFLHFACNAQLRIVKADTFPTDPTDNTWFHNSKTLEVWSYANGKWAPRALYPVDTVCQCAQFALLGSNGSGMGFRHEPVWALSDREFWCGEKLVKTLNKTGDLYFFDENQEVVAYINTGYCSYLAPKIKFQGMDAFCVPFYTLQMKMNYADCELIHGWGILGTNAEWLIAPKFDAPFHFKHGIAEVLYYGQKRKINEKGEFVE